jgi:hypothetical protein
MTAKCWLLLSFIPSLRFVPVIFGLAAAASWRSETARFSKVSAAQTPAMAVRNRFPYPGPGCGFEKTPLEACIQASFFRPTR